MLTEAEQQRALELHAGMCVHMHTHYPLLGVARALHQNVRREAMSFADKPYLIPLYAFLDQLKEASFCKAPQTGISELLIQKILYDSGWRGRICGYVLPQYKTSERFVSGRIDPLIQEVPAYRAKAPGASEGAKIQSKGNLKQKRFGPTGSILFLGSNTASDFLEFSADTIVIDEYDECDLKNVAKARDRVRESPHPQIFTVSNPSSPGEGIHQLWKEGSRAKWNLKCGHCNERQPLDWEINIVKRSEAGHWIPRDAERAMDPGLGDLRPVCRRCKRVFDRTVDGAVWIAEAPGETPSFLISRLDVLPSAKELQPLRKFYAEWVKAQGSPTRLGAFWAGVLGLPRDDAGAKVTAAMLEKASTAAPTDWAGGEEYKKQTVIMGVDVGSLLNVCISVLEKADTPSGYRRIGRRICTVAAFEDLIELQRQYNVEVIAIDAMPETRKCQELRDHFVQKGGCEVWLVRYHPSPRVGVEAFGLTISYDDRVVTVDRTQLLDCTLDEINAGHRTFPSDVGTVLGFVEQMRAPTRMLDASGGRIIWSEGNDPDHFRHADAYERVAQEMHDRMGGFYDV